MHVKNHDKLIKVMGTSFAKQKAVWVLPIEKMVVKVIT